MLRHASIYRVTRSCKINQRGSVCQQKATMKKNICLPSKEKSAFSQLQRIENKLYHQTWSRAKLQTARRKLWCEKSFGEFWVPGKLLRLGGCFSAAGMGRGQEMVEGSLYWKKKCVFSSAVCCCSQNFTLPKESCLAGESSGKRCSTNAQQLQQRKSCLCFTLEGSFFLSITDVMYMQHLIFYNVFKIIYKRQNGIQKPKNKNTTTKKQEM